jgi:hypothetical protein
MSAMRLARNSLVSSFREGNLKSFVEAEKETEM